MFCDFKKRYQQVFPAILNAANVLNFEVTFVRRLPYNFRFLKPNTNQV